MCRYRSPWRAWLPVLAALGAISVVLVPCCPPGGAAAEPALARFTYAEPHMGTQFRIIVYAPDQPTADGAVKAAFARIAELDGIMSDYQPASELMRLCRKAGGDPVAVSDDLFAVLARAQEIARISDGAFDVTVGPVVRLWRRARRTHQLPDPDDLARARELVGYKKVLLDEKSHTVQLKKTGMLLDLGGIGKGYASDAAVALLKKQGIGRALVAGGGDIAVSGPPPDAEGWTIGIAPMENPAAKPSRYLLLHDAGVSTSGDAEQYVEIDGKRYSHIVDPRTGIGLVGRLSVTVVAPNDTTADALTKVVCVLGPERGLAIIEETKGTAALLVRKTEKGVETLASRRFAELPHKTEPDKAQPGTP